MDAAGSAKSAGIGKMFEKCGKKVPENQEIGGKICR